MAFPFVDGTAPLVHTVEIHLSFFAYIGRNAKTAKKDTSFFILDRSYKRYLYVSERLSRCSRVVRFLSSAKEVNLKITYISSTWRVTHA